MNDNNSMQFEYSYFYFLIKGVVGVLHLNINTLGYPTETLPFVRKKKKKTVLKKLNVCAENMRDEKRGSVTHKGDKGNDIYSPLFS